MTCICLIQFRVQWADRDVCSFSTAHAHDLSLTLGVFGRVNLVVIPAKRIPSSSNTAKQVDRMCKFAWVHTSECLFRTPLWPCDRGENMHKNYERTGCFPFNRRLLRDWVSGLDRTCDLQVGRHSSRLREAILADVLAKNSLLSI